ncbi:MAG: DMT family transporter [Betaproteobacteria bacterium]|nr:DMT family transporter [Betaproteobacteria bacterium]
MTDTRQHPLRGILLILSALFFFAALDATSKHLAQKFAVPLLVWARYTLHCILMVIFLAPSMRIRLIATQRPLIQVTRALMLVGTTGFLMAALRLMPLAETTAILFVTPLLVALLAGPWLGEKIGVLRWLAVLTGFAGALLIARPGGALSGPGILLALTGAVCYSVYQIQTRLLSSTENTFTMLFYTALVGTVVMTLGLPWFWDGPRPDGFEMLLIASMGVYGGTGHYLLTRAFRHAPASTLSPFMYAQLIWATLLGWQVFGHLPDGWSILGMIVIAGSGLAVVLVERRGKKNQPLPKASS